ncbi:MAG: hypothetical protein WC464_03535 [Bdellovibrionales bacterium]
MSNSQELFRQISRNIIALDDITFRIEKCVHQPPAINLVHDEATGKDTVRVAYFLFPGARSEAVEAIKKDFFLSFQEKMAHMAHYLRDVDSSERDFPKVGDKIKLSSAKLKVPLVSSENKAIEAVIFDMPLSVDTAEKLRQVRLGLVIELGQRLFSETVRMIDDLTGNFPEEDGKFVRKKVVESGVKEILEAFLP